MSDLQQLLAQRAALDAQIAETQNRQRSEALAQIKTLMSDYGLSVADLAGRSSSVSRVSKGSKVAAKYRNQATGETWTGRGLKPRWLASAIEGGAKLEDFAV